MNHPYLITKKALLHLVISANNFKHAPGKLLVELPGCKHHDNCRRANESANGKKIWLGNFEYLVGVDWLLQLVILLGENECCVDLVDLNSRVNGECKVGKTGSHDLDRILGPKGVPHEDILIKEAKDEEG